MLGEVKIERLGVAERLVGKMLASLWQVTFLATKHRDEWLIDGVKSHVDTTKFPIGNGCVPL